MGCCEKQLTEKYLNLSKIIGYADKSLVTAFLLVTVIEYC